MNTQYQKEIVGSLALVKKLCADVIGRVGMIETMLWLQSDDATKPALNLKENLDEPNGNGLKKEN